MTTNETDNTVDLTILNANLEKIEELSQRLVTAFSEKREISTSLQGPSQDLYAQAAANLGSALTAF